MVVDGRPEFDIRYKVDLPKGSSKVNEVVYYIVSLVQNATQSEPLKLSRRYTNGYGPGKEEVSPIVIFLFM